MPNKVTVWRGGEWVTQKRTGREHPTGTSTIRESGGKRKRKGSDPRETLSGTVLKDALLRVREIDPNATLHVAAGRRVKMITYVDPSRKNA